MNNLVESEINEMNEIMQEEVTGYKVENLDNVNWCFRKISAMNEIINKNKQLADKERLRIDTWEQKENSKWEQSIEFFQGAITEYFLKLKQDDPKAKLSTPYGKVSTRKATKWTYNDELALLKYIKENKPELIKTEEKVVKTDLKKLYKDGIDKETGELLPGVEVTTEENITIKAE